MAANPDTAALETAFTAVEVDFGTALEQGDKPPQFHIDAFSRAFVLRKATERLTREPQAAPWPPRPDNEMGTLRRLYQSLIEAFTRRAEQIATETAATPSAEALDAFAAAWNYYDLGIGAITGIHRYLTLRYIDAEGLESIHVLGDCIFGKVVTQRFAEVHFPDVCARSLVFGLSLTENNVFTSREARLYDLVSQCVMRRAIQAGAKLEDLGPDAALCALPAAWDAYNADMDAVEGIAMQVNSLTRYIESEGIESVEALGKRFFNEETFSAIRKCSNSGSSGCVPLC